LPAGVGDAILAHNAGKAGATPMEKALLAVDPATGFIVACALMHPEKKIAACDVPFLVRRFGEKRFAAGASREQMALCSELGLSLEEFLAVCLEGMAAAAPTLGL
jgi:predicted hydrolase (HD superfamily)